MKIDHKAINVPSRCLHICVKRELLWKAYNQTLAAFSRSINELKAEIGLPDFQKKVQNCQESNQKCKDARTGWEEHVREHQCLI